MDVSGADFFFSFFFFYRIMVLLTVLAHALSTYADGNTILID